MGEIFSLLPPPYLESHIILGKMPEGYKIVYYAKNPFAVWTLLQSARLCFAEKWMESVIGSIAMTTVTNGLPQTGAFSQKKTFF